MTLARLLCFLLAGLTCHGAALLPAGVSLPHWRRPELQLTGGANTAMYDSRLADAEASKTRQELDDDEALRGAGVVVVGVTGGIASGKSTVARMLGKLGADVIDTDSLGHTVYEPGTACFKEIVEAFSDDILHAEDGRIDRKKLGGSPRRQPEP